MKQIAGIFLMAFALCASSAIVTAQQNKAEQMYQQALYEMEGKGDYAKAIGLFNTVAARFPKEKPLAAKALLHVGMCQEILGRSEATKVYERVIRDFADQRETVAEARTRLNALKQPVDSVARQSKPSNRRVWAGPDMDNSGSPSPDGRYLSYTDHKKNSLGIYDLKTGERTILSNPDSGRVGMYVFGSVWSPDGKQLAYTLNSEVPQAEIHLINVDGTKHRALCTRTDTAGVGVWVLDWSRDGKMILGAFMEMSTSAGIPRIGIVSVDDGSIRFIKTLDNWNPQMSSGNAFFSPDCRFIAYSCPTEKKSKALDVFVIAVDGSSEVNITQHPADDRLLGWEPNGNRLLFSSDRGGSYNLWAVQIVDGRPQGYPKLLGNSIGKISPMGLTNDGSLYYSVEGTGANSGIGPSVKESNIYLASLDQQTGKTMSEPIPATMHNNGFNYALTWSPDGKKLLYRSWFGNANGLRKVFMLSTETGSEQEVVHTLGSDSTLGYVNWFPDGKHLVLMANNMPKKANGIYQLEIQSGEMMPLAIGRDTIYRRPCISSDGKKMFFLLDELGIDSYDFDTKERKMIFRCSENQRVFEATPSPDGKHVAFLLTTWGTSDASGYSLALMLMSSTGEEPRALDRMNTGTFWTLDWSKPDGKYIYFTKKSSSTDPFELFRISVLGGIPEPMGLTNGNLNNFCIRPDGKQIAFSAGIAAKPAIWVLENVFGDGSGK